MNQLFERSIRIIIYFMILYIIITSFELTQLNIIIVSTILFVIIEIYYPSYKIEFKSI